MMAVAMMAGASASLAGEQGAQGRIAVPSGQEVTLHEVLIDDAPGARWVRFRFVAPRVGAPALREIADADMNHLCAAFALPYLAEQGIEAARVAISLSERAVPFGTAAPDVPQFFDLYRPEGGACIWDGF